MTTYLRGIVEAVSTGQDPLGGIDAMGSTMQRRQGAALYLRLHAEDGNVYTVCLRGTRFRGAPPRVGDVVRVPDRWTDGRLEPDHLINESTSGERVQVVKDTPARIGYSLVGLVVVLVILAAFAWVGYGFWTQLR